MTIFRSDSGETVNYKKDVLLNTLGNVAYLGALWLMSILVVRFSGYEDAGLFALAMTTSNIYVSLASYSIRLYYASDISHNFSDSQYILSRIFTVGSSMLICVLSSLVVGYNAVEMLAIVLFYVYKSAEMASDILFGTLQRYGKLYLSGYSLIVKSILSLLLFSGVLYATKNLLLTLLLMAILSVAILIFVDVRMVKRHAVLSITIHKSDIKPTFRLLVVCFPVFIVGLCYNVIPSLPRLSFERMYSTEELGYYSSIATISVLIATFVNCLVIPLIPKLSEHYHNGQAKKMLKGVMLTILCTIVLSMAAYAFVVIEGNWLLNLLFGPEILAYAYIFPPVILATMLTAIIICVNSFFVVTDAQTLLMVGALIGAGICVVTVSYFCRTFYMMGIPISLFISQAIELIFLAVCIAYIMHRIKNKTIMLSTVKTTFMKK